MNHGWCCNYVHVAIKLNWSIIMGGLNCSTSGTLCLTHIYSILFKDARFWMKLQKSHAVVHGLSFRWIFMEYDVFILKII